MIYSTDTTAAIFDAITAAETGNNGYAHIKAPTLEVARALGEAGYWLTNSRDAFGRACTRIYTPRAWEIACAEHNATVRALVDRRPSFDYEGATLARQERRAARQEAA